MSKTSRGSGHLTGPGEEVEEVEEVQQWYKK